MVEGGEENMGRPKELAALPSRIVTEQGERSWESLTERERKTALRQMKKELERQRKKMGGSV
ncbi:MAG: hypothetical protein LUE31_09950 [Lachnospiraceae bacterium]|nr:hypothetical protein [Lachnospiraceae bacterium]